MNSHTMYTLLACRYHGAIKKSVIKLIREKSANILLSDDNRHQNMPYGYIFTTTQSSTFPMIRGLLLGNFNLLLDLLEINMRHLGIITIEDLSQFLESGTPCLNIEEVDKAELDEDPNGVDQRQVPVVRKVLPCNWVGVTRIVSFVQIADLYSGQLTFREPEMPAPSGS